MDFVHRQIHEITGNYGKVDLLWLDAGWCGQGKEDLQMDRLAEIARRNQPELIIVDRMMGGRHENYVTPERKIPSLEEIPTKVWESNIPIGNDWGYVPHDTFKSSQELVDTLIDVVSKGGNLILEWVQHQKELSRKKRPSACLKWVIGWNNMGKAFTRPELDQKRGRRIGILPIAKIKNTLCLSQYHNKFAAANFSEGDPCR